MKKALLIVLAVGLMVGGAWYSAWWLKASKQFRAFATSDVSTRELFDAQSHLGRAFSVIGVEFWAPPAGDNADSPAALAQRVHKAMRTRMLAGVFATVGGVLATVVALRMKGVRPKPSTTPECTR